jgi:uncharacterized protein
VLILWDEHKRFANIAKHGLDFADLEVEFFASALVVPSPIEDRFVAIGQFKGEAIIVVVFRPLGSEAVSVISMRRASRKERRLL